MKFLQLLAFMAFTVASVLAIEDMRKCEPMKNDMCKNATTNDFLYSKVMMPNFANHLTQADAIGQMATYLPLISSDCSKDLQFFLCSVYVPMCYESPDHSFATKIGPCRPLCQSVKAKCEPNLRKAKFPWPEDLNCSKFPLENTHEHPCMYVPNKGTQGGLDLDIPVSSLNSLQSNPYFLDKARKTFNENSIKDDIQMYKPYLELINNQSPAKAANQDCGSLKKSHEYWHHTKKGCIPKCQSDILYSKDAKFQTNSIIVALAGLTFVCSTITVIMYTFNHCANSAKTIVAYAKWAPVYLALSFVGYTFGLLLSQIGQIQDPKWTCVQDEELSAAKEGHRSTPCIIVFLFVYFFGLATSTWWCVVASIWTIAQSTTINKPWLAFIAKLGHVVGWGIPAFLTLLAILLQKVQADELTSLCLPGGLEDNSSLLGFLVIPEGFFSALGLIIYIIGSFYAFCCGNATTDEKVRGKMEAKTFQSLKWKMAFYGALFLVCRVSFISKLTDSDTQNQ